MGRSIIIIAIAFAASFHAFAGDADTSLQLQLVKTINGSFNNFYIDNLGNIYTTDARNQIKKFTSEGDSASVFNDVRRYGNAVTLDVTNPLRILVYYKDFSTILLLDRFLNVLTRIDLRSQNLLQVIAAAQSYDNRIWVYDDLEAKLKKLDDKGNVLFESADFRLLFNDVPHPSTIIDNNGQLYLYDNKTGWFIFDYYGALKAKVAFTNWSDVDVHENYLMGHDTANFYRCLPKQLQCNEVKSNIPLASFSTVRLANNKVYALSKQGMQVYSVSR